MEAECNPQIDGSSGQSRIPQTFHSSELANRSQGLQELSELHVPTHELTHNSEASDSRHRASADIASSGDSSHIMALSTVHQTSSAVNALNMDRYSVRSSAQITTSTSAASLAPSSDAFSMAMTVSSAPTSTSSRFSDVSRVNVLELEKGVFAAPKLPLGLKDRSAWDNIRPRLQDTIDNTLKTRQGLESTISCEFMMGGPSPKQLKPTVFLVCCHEAYRKQLKGILKRQKWIRQYDYQWVVVVDAFEDLSFGSLEATPSTDSIRVYASFSSNTTSLCGLKARAEGQEHQGTARFTIGGILLIDNKEFGLTVGHVVEKLVSPQDAKSESDDEEYPDSSPFMTFDEEDSVNMTSTSSTKKLASVLEDAVDHDEPSTMGNFVPSQEDGCAWNDFGHFHASTSKGSTMRRKQLDWTLVSLDPELKTFQRPLINTLEIPSGGSIPINRFLQKSAIIAGEVWIKAGSTGVVRGWLMDSLVVFHKHEKTFPVLQVMSDQPLARGDSGSWVLMDNALCGHVLASRKSVPWLYVLPIFDIVTEVKATLSSSDVTLPQSHFSPGRNVLMNGCRTPVASGSHSVLAERAYKRSTTQQRTGISNSRLRNYGSIPSQVPEDLDSMKMKEMSMFNAFVGSGATTAPSNWSAYGDYCRPTMRYLHLRGFDRAAVLDISQMIRCGLHKHEIVAILEQRIPFTDLRSIREAVDRVASLLVMVDIGDNHAALGCGTMPQRMPWAHGTLRDNISNYFERQMNLSDTDIRLDSTFTTDNLVNLAGLRISWTANLADHLRLDGKRKMMHVFHHVTFLEWQRKSSESLLPRGLAEETLTTLALLFPSHSSKAADSWIESKAIASEHPRNASLHSFGPYDLSIHGVGTEPVELYQRDIGTFYHWHDRLVILKRALDESSAVHGPRQLWNDRRNSMQWYTLWSTVLTSILSVILACLGAVQVAMSRGQFSMWSDAQSKIVSTDHCISPASSLSPSPTATASLSAKDDGGHHLSSGVIFGIVFAAVGVCGAVLAMEIYYYYTHRKRFLARSTGNFVDGDIVNLVDSGRSESNSKAGWDQQ